MSFIECFKQAFNCLKTNKLRSFLTMLGIIMGVFSVIAIVAIGNATKAYVFGELEKLGANSLTIMYQTNNMTRNDYLTLDDLETVKNSSPDIKNVMTEITRSGTIRIGEHTRSASINGVSSQYKSIRSVDLVKGRFINSFDESAKSKVVVVDDMFIEKYFKNKEGLGETITLSAGNKRTKLKIVGIVSSESNFMGDVIDYNMFPADIYLPISTVQSIFYNYPYLNNITASVYEENQLKSAGKSIISALERKKKNKDIYISISSADQQKAFGQILGVVSMVLLVIAVITLIVGGIGIVNILLVSVTERIREIGIRKALGAQKSDIIMQFVTESIIMTGISGIIGIIMGILAGSIISKVIGIPPIVDFKVSILALAGSVLLGLLFGVYPAKKAADLDPIESLRYE